MFLGDGCADILSIYLSLSGSNHADAGNIVLSADRGKSERTAAEIIVAAAEGIRKTAGGVYKDFR